MFDESISKTAASSLKGRRHFYRFRPLLVAGSKIFGLLPLRLKLFVFQLLRGVPWMVGKGGRYLLLKSISNNVGDNVSISENVYIHNAQNLLLGSNVSIHPMCYLECAGGLKIGSEVSIAHSVTIMTTAHNIDNMSVYIRNAGVSMSSVEICDNVWIGAGVRILSGLTVGSGAVVGAGAVVTKSVRENEVVAGVPARHVKFRGIGQQSPDD